MRKGIRIYDPSALCAGGASDGAACRRVEHCFQVGVSPTLEGGGGVRYEPLGVDTRKHAGV